MFSNAAKYYLKHNKNTFYVFFKIIQLTILWAEYDNWCRALFFATTQFTAFCKAEKLS